MFAGRSDLYHTELLTQRRFYIHFLTAELHSRMSYIEGMHGLCQLGSAEAKASVSAFAVRCGMAVRNLVKQPQDDRKKNGVLKFSIIVINKAAILNKTRLFNRNILSCQTRYCSIFFFCHILLYRLVLFASQGNLCCWCYYLHISIIWKRIPDDALSVILLMWWWGFLVSRVFITYCLPCSSF